MIAFFNRNIASLIISLLLFVDLVREKRFIHLGPKKADFLKQVTLDAEFLASLNIMDYSLLVRHLSSKLLTSR